MRIAILWTQLSGYFNSCLKELASREGVELFVSHQGPGGDAPFEETQFTWMSHRFVWRTPAELDSLASRVRDFAPSILVFAGWHVPAHRQIARGLANNAWRVMTMDNCWRATAKQIAGTWIAPYFLFPIADAVWLPGERQATFARKMGFTQQRILRGLYSCDQTAMDGVHIARVKEDRSVPRSFLFVGRLIPEKCADVLVKAYEIYRNSTANPWPLVCCGTGRLQSRLEGKDGVRVAGFIQPERMPEILASAGCLVLPSQFEPWAVVVHEATSAGLLILASETVGAVSHLVQPGYNGFIFGTKDVGELARLMSHVSAMSDARLDEMSRASFLLSRQFSPKRWADTLLQSYAIISRSAQQ